MVTTWGLGGFSVIVILHLQSNFYILICHEILSLSICPLTYVCISLGSNHKPSTVESKIHELLSKERGGLGTKDWLHGTLFPQTEGQRRDVSGWCKHITSTVHFISVCGNLRTFCLMLELVFVLLWESNVITDLTAGGAQAVMWPTGSGCKYRRSFAGLLTSCCVAWFLTGHGQVLVRGLGTGVENAFQGT